MAILAPAAPLTIDRLLEETLKLTASDLHLVAGSPPTCRVNGVLRGIGGEPITDDLIRSMLFDVCPASKANQLQDASDVDFAMQRDIIGQTMRFRVNVFHSRGTVGCAIRALPIDIPSLEWAGFPLDVADRLTGFRNGLALFTGITGSGKSTSMAMLIDRINQRGGVRILTIEDPIEYVFNPASDTIVSQREVGIDVPSFAAGLRFGLRQDPDVILVGEIRDRETAQMAISAAETGHLVLATMHTRDAKGAITRIVDLFPGDAHTTVRTQLALSLRMVVSQHLVPRLDGSGRALALEVLLNTLPVSSAIRSGRTETLDDVILSGKTEGMLSLDDRLRQLLQEGVIDLAAARVVATDPRRLQ